MIGESPIAPKPLLGNGFGGAAGTGEWGGGECRSECGGVGTKIALGGKQTGELPQKAVRTPWIVLPRGQSAKGGTGIKAEGGGRKGEGKEG